MRWASYQGIALRHAVKIARSSARKAPEGTRLKPVKFGCWRYGRKGYALVRTLTTLDHGNWRRVPLCKLPLMPIGIDGRDVTGAIQLHHMLRSQIPSRRREILPQLLLVACSDDYARNRRPLQQPIQCNLWHALASFFCDLIQRVDHFMQIIILNLRAVVGSLMQSAGGRQWLIAANFSRQTSPTQRTSD